MNTDRITFREFEALLLRLGFAHSKPRGDHRYYRHDASDTVILLPDYAPDDLVRPHHAIAIRRLLDEKGLLESVEYDRVVARSYPTQVTA